MEPDELDAILERANRLIEAGKPEEALRCLDDAEGRCFDSEDRIEHASLRAWALTELGRDEEALDALDALLEEFPQSARLLSTLGVVLSNSDELEDARAALEEAVSVSPSDEVSLANLGLVYEKLRDYRRALELYDRALDSGADIDWVLQRRAAALIECGCYGDAKKTLNRYLSLVPEDATQWVTLGILYSDDDDFESAFECYRRAEEIDPDGAALRLNWGVTAVRAKQLGIARSQLAHLKRVEPTTTRPWLLAAFILEDEGELLAARTVYDRILSSAQFQDQAEMSYALEMAMDFFARHKLRRRSEQLFRHAYAANACSVELCEAYREVQGDLIEPGYWFSVLVEADYRPGLAEVQERRGATAGRRARFVRDYQIVARDRDDAISHVLDFARRMGERNPCVREFIGEEEIERAYAGIYEIEAESLILADEGS